jgi:hypothetical protein
LLPGCWLSVLSWLRCEVVAGITRSARTVRNGTLAARLEGIDRFTSAADVVDNFQKTG